jgi:putative transposase
MYPTREQEVLLLEHCAHARYVWNLGLEQRLMWRRWQGRTPGFAEQCRQLAEARASESWLAVGSQVVQQQALRDLGQAWRHFFGGTHDRPTWRRKGRHEGFRVVGRYAPRIREDNHRWSSVLIPKIGWIRFRRSRSLPDWKSYRVTRDRAGRWHIALAAIPAPVSARGTGEVVGVDRGVTAAATLSTGEMSSPAELRRKEAERLLRLQRRLARARKGSNRRAALKAQIARIKAREADRRKDWVEKTSTDLVRRFDLVRVEDLKVTHMTRSARGTAVAPGRNARQKAGLNRAIRSKGWGQLVVRLEQKAPGRVEKVNPAYTSQTCNACGHCAPENRKSQAVFLCVACGHQANADVNAACNIRDKEPAAGLAVAARGDRAKSARSMKREPQQRPAA